MNAKTHIMILVTVLSVTIPDISHSADKWSKKELSLASTFTLATIVDWGQTRDMVKRQRSKSIALKSYVVSQDCGGKTYINFYSHEKSIQLMEDHCTVTSIKQLTSQQEKQGEAYYEINPLLGKRPSLSEVDKYMPIAIGSVLLISHYLPSEWRSNVLYVLSVLEVGVIGHNYNIGLNINF